MTGANSRAVEAFLTTGNIPDDVSPTTARSWMRSREFGIAPDAPLDLRYAGPVEDGALLRATRPIAEKLFSEMQGTDLAMLLTDADARVLGRWCGHQSLAAHLDKVGSSVGFIFEEARAGTSALGTVLEEGEEVQVLGHEHYVECLRGLSAVGVPVVHPVSGRIEGVVDLVCPQDQHSPMMRSLIVRAAEEIGARLLTGYAGQDRVLLYAYLQADRHGPRRAMLAINGRVLIANPQAANLVSASHAMLWDRVERALSLGRTQFMLYHDDNGMPVHGVITEIRDAGERVGAVVQLRKREKLRLAHLPVAKAPDACALLLERLPGVSNCWRGALKRSSAVFRARERLLLTGPVGVGKRALGVALCETLDADREISEHDAAEAGVDLECWLDRLADPGTGASRIRVLTHLDRLNDDAMERVVRWLDHLPPETPPLIATCTHAEGRAIAPLLAGQFPHIIELPRLADRPEDIPDIAAALVCECPGDAVRLDPAAVSLLVAADWPGNVRQLRRIVLAAGAMCPGTVIRPTDIPDQCRVAQPRFGLTRLQRLERETIIATLRAEGGNKLAAAANLGISRSTLYRKLTVLGLDG